MPTDLTILGVWGMAVLVASMAGTQYLKDQLKACGVTNNWLFMSIPFILSGIGSLALVVGKQIAWMEFPEFWFVIGFGGNVIYKVWKKTVGVSDA